MNNLRQKLFLAYCKCCVVVERNSNILALASLSMVAASTFAVFKHTNKEKAIHQIKFDSLSYSPRPSKNEPRIEIGREDLEEAMRNSQTMTAMRIEPSPAEKKQKGEADNTDSILSAEKQSFWKDLKSIIKGR